MVSNRDLWTIVSSAKTDIQQFKTTKDAVFFKWAIDGFRELNNYGLVLPSGKTARLTLDSDYAALLPDDCAGREAIYKIGTCVNGKWVNLYLNPTICMSSTEPCSCSEAQELVSTGCGCSSTWWNTGCQYLGFWENGQYVAGVYGAGAGIYNGGYNIDDGKRRIQFDVSLSEVLIEYRTDGGLVEYGNAFVPEILIRPLVNFVHRERCTFESENTTDRFRSNFLSGQAVKFGKRYVNGVKAAAHQLKGMSAQDLLYTWRSSIHQLPKR